MLDLEMDGLDRQRIYIIGSVGVAMSVGIISLFTNDYIIGQRFIGAIQIIVYSIYWNRNGNRRH